MPHLLLKSDARRIPLRDASVQMVITSPPYFGLRDYGDDRQIGLEQTPAEYVRSIVSVFAEVWRVLRDDGCVFLNLGDSYNSSPPGNKNPMSKSGLNGAQTSASYRARLEQTQQTQQEGRKLIAGLKPKDRMGIPHRLVFALQDDGWYWRDEIIWFKRNPMPESVTDRTTKAHEMVFLLTKNERYFHDNEAIKEEFADDRKGNPGGGGEYSIGSGRNDSGVLKTGLWNEDGSASGRNARSVWDIPTVSFKGSHFATMPPKLAERCILAGTSEKGSCAECGTPYGRLTEKVATGRIRNRAKGGLGKEHSRESHGLGAVEGQFQEGVSYKTLGWGKACSCESNAVRPCIVLDPFNGSGTSGSVATGLNRDYVGLDISDEYLTMARRRIERPHARPLRTKVESLPLFGE